jgi:small-conductance mechanosensitive channel
MRIQAHDLMIETSSFLVLLTAVVLLTPSHAQTVTGSQTQEEQDAPVSESIDIEASAGDEKITARLRSILNATGWFETIDVRTESGVVFLDGTASDDAHRRWAGDLARNTEGVTAVVNNVALIAASPWDLDPAIQQVRELGAALLRSLPLFLIGGALLALTWLIARWVLRSSASGLTRRVRGRLLRDVLSRALAALVFIVGLYVVMRVSGLTGLAVTIIGGTGLLGLAIGFAFRDIAENFLASILISIQRPFAMGDLISVDGHEGFVQRVNTRATLIMTRDGNHVQVPNSIVYKQTITNFTANPRARERFDIGIGYDDCIADAQTVALQILRDHPAVLDDPEPLVLVEALSAATVNLRLYFWIDIETYNQLKVRSALIRMTKSAFDEAGISMPDEAREVVFPAGVPVNLQQEARAAVDPAASAEKKSITNQADSDTAHQAEGDLLSDDEALERQARESRLPEGGSNLL